MKIICLFRILILAAILSAGCSSTMVTVFDECPGTIIRVGTYNMKNVFDSVDDPLKYDGPAPSRERIKQLAEVIISTDCDILAVQEVENREVLDSFNIAYLNGLYGYIVLVEGNDPRGIDVGFLSKLPLYGLTSYKDYVINEPIRRSTAHFSRDLLRIQWISPDRTAWNILTTHLKSGSTVDDRIARAAQAGAIAEICRRDGYVSEWGSGYSILLGDLNAEPSADDLSALNYVPFSDPARDLPSRYTHASGMVLDYILLSPDAGRHYAVGSCTIFRDGSAREASDHYLVYLDLTF